MCAGTNETTGTFIGKSCNEAGNTRGNNSCGRERIRAGSHQGKGDNYPTGSKERAGCRDTCHYDYTFIEGPGDTAAIDVKWQNPDEPMLVDIVEAGITTGDDYGILMDYYGRMGTYLNPVEPPTSSSSFTEIEFWFIANDSIDVDTARVGIRVGVGVFQWDASLPVGKGKVVARTAASNGISPAGSQSKSGVTDKVAGTGGAGTVSVTADTFWYSPYGVAWLTITKKRGGPNLSFPRYSQGDSLWADSTYDHDVKRDKKRNIIKDKNGNPIYYTIQNMGCALCGMAWVLSAYGYLLDGNPINPLQLNDWMNGQNSSHGGYSGSSVNWYAIDYISGGSRNAVETSLPPSQFGNLDYASDVNVLNKYLDNGDLVIAEVNDGGSTHWVVVEPKTNGEYPIVDPGHGDRTNIEAYHGNIWEYVVISQSHGK